MKVLKFFGILLLGIILGVGGVALTVYLIITTGSVGTVTNLVGLNDETYISQEAKDMSIGEFIGKLLDVDNMTIGEYEALLPIIGQALEDNLTNNENVNKYVKVNDEMLKTLTLSGLINSVNGDSGLIEIVATLGSLGLNMDSVKNYSIFKNTYYSSNIFNQSYVQVLSDTDENYDATKALFRYELADKTVTRVADFAGAEGATFMQLSNDISSDYAVYGYKNGNAYAPVENFHTLVASATVGEELTALSGYDGFFQLDRLLDSNYDNQITDGELAQIYYADYSADYKLYYIDGDENKPTVSNLPRAISMSGENGTIEIDVPDKSYFVYRTGLADEKVENCFDVMGKRINELYLAEICQNIDETPLKSFKNLTVGEIENGDLDAELDNSYLCDFVDAENNILKSICYYDGNPENTADSNKVKIGDLSARLDVMTLGEVIEITVASPFLMQSLSGTKLDDLANVKLTVSQVFDMDSPDTTDVIKSLRYKKTGEANVIEKDGAWTYGYESGKGYVYSGGTKIYEFSLGEDNAMHVYDIGTDGSTFNYLVEKGTKADYLLTLNGNDSDGYTVSRLETLVDDIGSQFNYLPLSAFMGADSTNKILDNLIKKGTTVDSLEDDINELTIVDVYGKEKVWKNVEYASLSPNLPTYRYDENTATFTLVSTNNGIEQYAVSGEYASATNLYQPLRDGGVWLYLMYDYGTANAYGDATTYVQNNTLTFGTFDTSMDTITDKIMGSTYQQLYLTGIAENAPVSTDVASRTLTEIFEIINA